MYFSSTKVEYMIGHYQNMICNISCANNGICSFNDTCICPMCFIGPRCEISTNVVKFSLTYAMYWDIRLSPEDSSFNGPMFVYTTVIAVMLFVAIINNIICLQTFLVHDIRLTNCGVFQILYCLIGLVTILGLQLRMLTMLKLDFLTKAYSYRYMACNIIPVLVIAMGDVCMWLSVLLVIEFILLESFNVCLSRSRRFSVISSIICITIVTVSHLHEIIARRPLPDPYEPQSYTCTFIYPLPLDIIDKTLRACHVTIPCSIHFISNGWILLSITRRILMVRGRHDFFRVFRSECVKRKHVLVPAFFIILANLPHLILHLKDSCEDSRVISTLRLHVAFNILVYLPPTITFFIYIYPSKSYMNKFRMTRIGRWLNRIVRKKRKLNIWTVEPEAPRKTLILLVPCTFPMMRNDR